MPSGSAQHILYMMKGFRQRVVRSMLFPTPRRRSIRTSGPMLMCRPNSKSSSRAPATRTRRVISSPRRRTAPQVHNRRRRISLLPVQAKRRLLVRPPTLSTLEVSRYPAQMAQTRHILAHPTLVFRVRARNRTHLSCRNIAHSAVQAAQIRDKPKEARILPADMATRSTQVS